MDTSTGEVKRLTDEEQEALNQRLGRVPQPGDRIDGKRVVVSRRVAAKARLANKAERKHQEKGRARRKRAEARARARQVQP